MTTNLPEPQFVSRNPQQIEAEAIALFEQLTDKKLYPAQPERLLLDVLTYRETLTRIAIQETGKQNLVNYATGTNLDEIGALLDVPRLPDSAALTTLKFAKDSGALNFSVVVPAGTRGGTGDRLVLFATQETLIIPDGVLSATVTARATVTGEVGNQIVDPVGNIAAVENSTRTNSGASVEDDDRYRERIKLAPNKFSVAGPVGAYKFWALSADQSIVDVAIDSPRRVQVKVYVLTNSGVPSVEILDKVYATVNDTKIRPLTDQVEVLAPTQINYSIQANVTLLTTADGLLLSQQLNEAIAAYTAERKAGLGRDIVRSQIIKVLSLPGVYNVSLVSPAVDLVVLPSEWANASAVTVSISGTNNG
jgi:phage-related baseplate assembly protein